MRELFLLCVLQRVLFPVCVVLCGSCISGGRLHWNGCMMLHGLCVGEEAGARNLVFFRVKWLQSAMKGTSSVRRLRLRSFHARIVPPMCFATSACYCVRSSMRFLYLWLQIALEWLHDVAWALCWGGSWSTKPCVFPCIKWLQSAMKGISSVRRLRLRSFHARICVLQRVVVSVCIVLYVS